VKEIVREMTVKAGQKCTAIRRAIAPKQHIDAVQEALSARLAKAVIGDPRQEGVTMGALASISQRDSVRQAVSELSKYARIVSGDPNHVDAQGEGVEGGAFMAPILLRSDDHGAPRRSTTWRRSGRSRP
jgi:oxepin-CoA hydrolase/3-oxo-5,6-dehydrosuberyl-CoA semialdehyde dehydrogenase